MSQPPASNENPLGTSNDIAPIRLVQQAATNFVDAITSLIQHYVRSPTSIPTTSIAASNATSDSNTSIGSTSGLSSPTCEGQGDVDIRRLKLLLNMSLTRTEIAEQLKISKPTLYTILKRNNLHRKYSLITDAELDVVIRAIKQQHPSVGQKMMVGHLRSRNIHVQRHRLRASFHRIDSEGIAARQRNTIERRCYSVPSPNFIWHIDGTHKLIRWKMVVHAGIDGYSRLITYCRCSPDNAASTVLSLFVDAVQKYGLPLKVRSDYGGENALVWRYMMERRLNRHSVLLGSSVHNQRIERLNRDLNTQVINYYSNLFSYMEDKNMLDPSNPTDIFVLQFLFLPIINTKLMEFMEAYNSHPISTCRNYTPTQLHSLNLRLLRFQCLDPSGAITVNEITCPRVSSVEVNSPLLPLSISEREELQALLARNAAEKEIYLYKLASDYVAARVSDSVR